MKLHEMGDGRTIALAKGGMPQLAKLEHREAPDGVPEYHAFFSFPASVEEVRAELEESMEGMIAEHVPMKHVEEAREKARAVLESVEEMLAHADDEGTVATPVPLQDADVGDGMVLVYAMGMN
jgi:hypothetical protein